MSEAVGMSEAAGYDRFAAWPRLRARIGLAVFIALLVLSALVPIGRGDGMDNPPRLPNGELPPPVSTISVSMKR